MRRFRREPGHSGGPGRDDDLPYDSVTERFRAVRDEIEPRMRNWLEHPEAELEKLREKRERGRRERLGTASGR